MGRVFFAALVLAVMSLPAQAQYFTLGGDDLDACASNGEVVGLKKGGDNFLAVRSGPGTSHAKIDELGMSDAVYICAEDGDWYGIVYGDGDCGVTSPINPPSLYSGPCSSGWVHSRYVNVTAG